MTVKTIVDYTNDEVHIMIDALNFLSNMLDSDIATTEMKHRAEIAFEEIAKLLCLDEKGKQAFEYEGW